MRLSASGFHGLYRPSPCDLRVYLRSKGVQEARPNPYEEVLLEPGQWHERKHLASIGDHVDLSGGDDDLRVRRTLEETHKRANVLYQPTLRIEANVGGTTCTLVGQPDFFIREGEQYVIRDVKLSKRINEKDHAEILLQMGLYGWLYERTFQTRPRRLEVLAGNGALVDIPFDWIGKGLTQAERIVHLWNLQSEPYSPVGWTKCGSCTFREQCWPAAVKRRDVAIVSGVDQNLARALREGGVSTIEELLSKFDETSLAAFEKPWGNRKQRVGKAAPGILLAARVLATGEEKAIQAPQIPVAENYAMFDLEGLPPQLDDLEKMYLWGVQVFGASPGEYLASFAGFGRDGDKEGWEKFLLNVAKIFEKYGDIPFIHWHHYEKTHVNMYIERFGDRNDVAARLKTNLFDLLPATEDSVVLPLSSYSLKAVEEYVGFKRTQEEYGGQWAMARFIRATEALDEVERARILGSILTYNREDLAATWAVFQWLRGKTNG